MSGAAAVVDVGDVCELELEEQDVASRRPEIATVKMAARWKRRISSVPAL